MTPMKLRTFCELEWPIFNEGWCPDRTLDAHIVQRVWLIVIGNPDQPDQFPYIDSWLEIVQNPLLWMPIILSKQSQANVLATLSGGSPREPKKQPTAPLIFKGDAEEDIVFPPPYDSSSSLPLPPELETPPQSVSLQWQESLPLCPASHLPAPLRLREPSPTGASSQTAPQTQT